jgi:hypothetical protein
MDVYIVTRGWDRRGEQVDQVFASRAAAEQYILGHGFRPKHPSSLDWEYVPDGRAQADGMNIHKRTLAQNTPPG